MMSARRLSVLLAIVLLFGCSSTDPKVQSVLDAPVDISADTNPDIDFSRYETWSWSEGTRGQLVDLVLNEESKRTVAETVEGQLFDRGYRRVDRGGDLEVNGIVTTTRIDEDYIRENYGGAYNPDYRGKSKTKTWQEGSLVFFVFDGKSKELVWTGSALGEVAPDQIERAKGSTLSTKGATQEQRDERLTRIVKEMFASFPKRS